MQITQGLRIAPLMASMFVLANCSSLIDAPIAGSAAAESARQTTSYMDAPGGTYALDKNHAYIVFSYSHQDYSSPLLRWDVWDSSLNWNPSNPESSSVSVTIDVAGIDTGVDVFDGHLKSERWFDAAAHPTITFESTGLEIGSGRAGKLTGDLTIKGVTKSLALDVTFNKTAYDKRSDSHKLGFSATGELNRSDFGLGAFVPGVSDTVDLRIEVEYAQPAS